MITQVGVLGAGQMGSGIAQVSAQAGFLVYLFDVDSKVLSRAEAVIQKSLQKLVEKGKLTEAEASQIKTRIRTTIQWTDFKNCSWVIEAVPEKKELKQKLFAELAAFVSREALVATNTSSIAISELARSLKDPQKFLGLHFMNPVPLMPLVEVIRGDKTSQAAYETSLEFVKKLGKTPVTSKDRPGFVVNRILMPMINEAAYAFEEGLASAEDIDQAMKLGCNFPMGPLTLADFIGLDTCVHILEVMQKDLPDEKFKPAPVLKKYVAEGRLGRKTRKGFYTYG